ncbi:Tetratricopeptide-like helical domain and Tetratricopeptide repeat-containing domain and Tetratricopeptide repeat-containing protein [Strongyloides ratti]|uniref:Tetratricopeptide-like helical domain and Tetratricopeptide repeat-containing domain and Tetratricopeptide repeat-containing protein n=1 Tax=Strongyloides ratti TaxID=34506 RepID=A0A090LJZ4_STRRB|nr:Tetratricopeptide-like helical domain and Tetratricopeptide repeat-containing domain and Tetratricopeptide repeat-containing protein [Strongyloides ratti]CEF68458.1 Tetratricopeptide-like helical domain and Tetratricopeptide repeat-containing domain and Tetratricopeptide repeat-containing protein [Strongyloides ratti]
MNNKQCFKLASQYPIGVPKTAYRLGITILLNTIEQSYTQNILLLSEAEKLSWLVTRLINLPDITYSTLIEIVKNFSNNDNFIRNFNNDILNFEMKTLTVNKANSEEGKGQEIKFAKSRSIIGYFLRGIEASECFSTPSQDFYVIESFEHWRSQNDIEPYKPYIKISEFYSEKKDIILNFLFSYISHFTEKPHEFPIYFNLPASKLICDIIPHDHIVNLINRQCLLMQLCPKNALSTKCIQMMKSILQDEYPTITKTSFFLMLNALRCGNYIEAESYGKRYFNEASLIIKDRSNLVTSFYIPEKKPLIYGPLICSRIYKLQKAKRNCQALIEEATTHSHASRDLIGVRACTLEKILSENMVNNDLIAEAELLMIKYCMDKYGDTIGETFYIDSIGNDDNIDEDAALNHTIQELEEVYPVLHCKEFNFIINDHDKKKLEHCFEYDADPDDAEAFFHQMAKHFLYIKTIEWSKAGKNKHLCAKLFEIILESDFGSDRFIQTKLIKDAALVALSTMSLEKGYYKEALFKAGIALNSITEPLRNIPSLATEIHAQAVANAAVSFAYSGNYEGALKVLEKYDKYFPKDSIGESYTQLRLTKLLVQFDYNFFKGEWETLRVLLEEINLYNYFEYDMRVGILDCCTNDVSQAISRLNNLIGNFSNQNATSLQYIRCLMVQGQMYLHIKNWEMAFDSFKKALKLAQENGLRNLCTMLIRRMATSMLKVGRIQQAGALLMSHRSQMESELPVIEQALYHLTMYMHAECVGTPEAERYLTDAVRVLKPFKLPLLQKCIYRYLINYKKCHKRASADEIESLEDVLKNFNLPKERDLPHLLL